MLLYCHTYRVETTDVLCPQVIQNPQKVVVFFPKELPWAEFIPKYKQHNTEVLVSVLTFKIPFLAEHSCLLVSSACVCLQCVNAWRI